MASFTHSKNDQKEQFLMPLNETDRFLERRYISLASKSCNESFYVVVAISVQAKSETTTCNRV